MGVEENLRLMKTLDDAWNAGPGSRDWETFRKRHTDNVAVYWPGQPEPTRGRHNHDSEAVEFFKTFPDNHLVNNPYKILFGQGDHTCSVAEFTGTMKGPMKGPDGVMIFSNKQEVPYRVLHGSHVEERRDRRGETELRPAGDAKTNRRNVKK